MFFQPHFRIGVFVFMFVDEIIIHIQSGSGGKGCESYYRRTDKKFVPTGGDGGKGGDVIIRADRNVTSLYSFRFNPLFRADSGQLGGGNQKTGRNGQDVVILVPCGTSVFNKAGHLLIRDLLNEGDEVIALRGGRGGIGNQHHGKMATPGEPGQSLDVVLDLKVKADIFFVGSPNSGKSRLLNYLTGSKAKSEAYPFATKSPQLGIFETADYKTFVLCELPSLVSGSSKGKALGNQFLKHLSRARLLFLMVDPFQSDFDAAAGYNELIEELKAYNPDFAGIPHFLLINKMDTPEASEAVKKKVNVPCPVFRISAETGAGIEMLMKEAEKRIFESAEKA